MTLAEINAEIAALEAAKTNTTLPTAPEKAAPMGKVVNEPDLAAEIAAMRAEIARIKAENAALNAALVEKAAKKQPFIKKWTKPSEKDGVTRAFLGGMCGTVAAWRGVLAHAKDVEQFLANPPEGAKLAKTKA